MVVHNGWSLDLGLLFLDIGPCNLSIGAVWSSFSLLVDVMFFMSHSFIVFFIIHLAKLIFLWLFATLCLWAETISFFSIVVVCDYNVCYWCPKMQLEVLIILPFTQNPHHVQNSVGHVKTKLLMVELQFAAPVLCVYFCYIAIYKSKTNLQFTQKGWLINTCSFFVILDSQASAAIRNGNQFRSWDSLDRSSFDAGISPSDWIGRLEMMFCWVTTSFVATLGGLFSQYSQLVLANAWTLSRSVWASKNNTGSHEWRPFNYSNTTG